MSTLVRSARLLSRSSYRIFNNLLIDAELLGIYYVVVSYYRQRTFRMTYRGAGQVRLIWEGK
jgi:hypothetical protein